MRKTRWVFLLAALFPALLSAQNVDNTQYVREYLRQHPTWSIGTATTAAQFACNPDTSIPCIIVFDPSLAKYATGTMPAACSQCQWLDYRNGAPYIPSGGGSAGPITASVNNVVNVMAPPYKAKGDCSTDDASAFTSAIAATPTGGTLLIPAAPGGCFLLGSAINITRAINIEGTGWNANTWGMTFGQTGFLGHFSGSVISSTVTSGTAFDINPSAAGLHFSHFAVVGPGSGTSTGIKFGDKNGSGYLNQGQIFDVFAGNFGNPISIFSQNSQYIAPKVDGAAASGTDPVGVGIYFDATGGGTANSNQVIGAVIVGGNHKNLFVQGQENQISSIDSENPAQSDSTAVALEFWNCNVCSASNGYIENATSSFTGVGFLVDGPAGSNNAIGSTIYDMHISDGAGAGDDIQVAHATHTKVIGGQEGGTIDITANAGQTNIYAPNPGAIVDNSTSSNIFDENGNWKGGNPHTIDSAVTAQKGLTIKQNQGGTEYNSFTQYIGSGFTGQVSYGTWEFAPEPQCTATSTANGCSTTIYHHFQYWNGTAATSANGFITGWSLSPSTGVATSATWRDNLSGFPFATSIRDLTGWTQVKLPAITTVNAKNVCLADGTNCPASVGTTQYVTITTGICTTGAAAFSSCNFAQTGVFSPAFSDTAYSITCGGAGAMTGTVTQVWVTGKTTTGFTVNLQNGDANGAVASTFAEIDCTARHN